MDNGGEAALPVDFVDGQLSDLSIRDVFEAISRADPLYGADVEMPRTQLNPGLPYVVLVEQPASKALRFRYECEGRSAGSIPGVNSTPERKSYPTIEIVGHRGQVIIVVSCVTRDEPYKPHPHNLVGRERCENGVCTLKTSITEENPTVSFSNLGIQCVKRKDITDALKTREKLRVDPFKTGFNHGKQPQSIDLNAVRLCFQVFIPDERTGKIRQSLQPIVSDIIYDKKAMSDLIIMRISHCTDFHRGGTEVILLCEKVTREDIAVMFFQSEKDGVVVWEAAANIVMVHKLTAIVFHTPPYKNINAQHTAKVYIQLKRVSDNARSNAIPFEYIPEFKESGYLKHKRQKTVSPTLQMYDPRYANEQIKSEPDKTPPHPVTSPLRLYSPYEQEQVQQPYQWGVQQNLNMPSVSHAQYVPDMQWNQNYSPLVPLPNHPVAMSNLQTLSPNVQDLQMGPMGRISPMHRGMSPAVGHVSPAMGHVSPGMGHVSPGMGHVSPGMGHVSPGMGHVSPGMEHNMSPNYVQQQLHQDDLMEYAPTNSMSLTNLLKTDGIPPLNSGDFPGFDTIMSRSQDLSDSLNKLSTSELLH